MPPVSAVRAGVVHRYRVAGILRHGRVRRAQLGIEAQTVAIPRRVAVAAQIGSAAVRIGAVERGGLADNGGLRPGDIIVAIDLETLAGTDDFLRKLSAEKIGRPVALRVLRNGMLDDFAVVPQERGREGT